MSLSDNVPKSVKKIGKPGTGTEASRWDHEHALDPNLLSEQVRVQKNDAEVGKREILNLKEGTKVTLTIVDDTINDRINVTIASSPGAGTIKTTLSFAVVGTLAVGTDKAPTILAPITLTIVKVKLVVKTAPTGAAIIMDVNKNGTTIFTTQANRPQIAIDATTGNSGTPDVTALAETDKLTIDVDQVGSTVAGADLTVEVVANQSVVFT